jgi:hypothetical protein
MNRDDLILEARKAFVAWNNSFETDHEVLLDADDAQYFLKPYVRADIAVGFYDRLVHVYQPLNDELISVEFIILADESYSEIKSLIIEADTNYSIVKGPSE